LGKDKDIFFAFLIANAGSENVDTRQFSTLSRNVISKGPRVIVINEGLEAQRRNERAEQAERPDISKDFVNIDAPRCVE
jgi:hypothetical protein